MRNAALMILLLFTSTAYAETTTKDTCSSLPVKHIHSLVYLLYGEDPSSREVTACKAVSIKVGANFNKYIAVMLHTEHGNYYADHLALFVAEDTQALTSFIQVGGRDEDGMEGVINIENEKIILTGLAHAPEDPGCCPSKPIKKIYSVNKGTLTLVTQ